VTGPALRWAVAVLVTIAAFAVATWICGAFVLTVHDGGVRWGIAGGLGVAVAALAALWGHSYATGSQEKPASPETRAGPSAAGGTSNAISGGTFHGPVIQGRDIDGLGFPGPSASERNPPPPPAAGSAPDDG